MISHTDPSLVSAMRTTEAPSYNRSASGYGPKIPSQYMIRYLNRWRRVYVAVFGNAGSAYIVVNGESHYLDTDTEHDLNNYDGTNDGKA